MSRDDIEKFVEKLGEDYVSQPKGTWLESEEEFHNCHFCGEYVNKEGYDPKGERHFLSDCRPDLVKHEIGETCTWAYRRLPEFNQDNTGRPYQEKDTCYAYQNLDGEWTEEHIHFYPDGPM